MSTPLSDAQLAAITADVKLAASGPMVGVPRGAQRYEAWVRIGDQHGATLLAEVERLRAELAELRTAEPVRPSPDHAAVYLDQHGIVWADYLTLPPGDYVLPLVWAGEQARSKADLAADGFELRVIGWSK